MIEYFGKFVVIVLLGSILAAMFDNYLNKKIKK